MTSEVQCCIQGCPQAPKGPIFTFPPVGSKLRDQWLAQINCNNPSQQQGICWLHFRLEDFVYQYNTQILQPPTKLLPIAVPTVFPWSTDWSGVLQQHKLISCPILLDSFAHFMDVDVGRRPSTLEEPSAPPPAVATPIPIISPPMVDLVSPTEKTFPPFSVLESRLPSSPTKPIVPTTNRPQQEPAKKIKEKENKKAICPDCGFGPMMGIHVCIQSKLISGHQKPSVPRAVATNPPMPPSTQKLLDALCPVPVKCPNCPFVAFSTLSLKIHTCQDGKITSLNCPFCVFSTKSMPQLSAHVQLFHPKRPKKDMEPTITIGII